jgi:primosomal protein N' (replication factor Y)
MVRIICESIDMEKVYKGVYDLADFIRSTAQGEDWECVVIGPAPAPFFKLRDRYRWHILIKARHSAVLTEFLAKIWHSKVVDKLRRRIKVTVDRDPITCL